MLRGSIERALLRALTVLCAFVVLLLAACARDAGTPADERFARSSGAVKTTSGTDGSSGVSRVDHVWKLVSDLTRRTGGLVKKCGTAGETSGDACLTMATLDGQTGTAGSEGCRYNNTCMDVAGRPKLRRPRVLTSGTYSGSHEGELLKSAVSFVTGLIRRNAFAPPAHVASTTAWFGQSPSYGTLILPWSQVKSRLNAINYDIFRYYDENMDRELLAIAPINWRTRETPDSDGRNWGIFLFNLQPSSYGVIEVPHPNFDLNSDRLAAEAFEKGDALGLFVAGAHREALNLYGEEYDSIVTAHEVRGKADVCHEQTANIRNTAFTVDKRSGFQWAHEGLFATSPDGLSLVGRLDFYVVQFHGFDEAERTGYGSDNADVVLSQGGQSTCAGGTVNGNTKMVTDIVTAFNANRKFKDGAANVNVADYYPSGQPERLIAAATAAAGDGRGLRAVCNVQGHTAFGSGKRFLSVEVDQAARQMDTSGNDKCKESLASPEPPKTINWIARKVIYAADQYMLSVGHALVKPALVSAKGWQCEGQARTERQRDASEVGLRRPLDDDRCDDAQHLPQLRGRPTGHGRNPRHGRRRAPRAAVDL